jgi:hypothetical protein
MAPLGHFTFCLLENYSKSKVVFLFDTFYKMSEDFIIGIGSVTDCNRLIDSFCEAQDFRFSVFAEKWKLLNFDLIFWYVPCILHVKLANAQGKFYYLF